MTTQKQTNTHTHIIKFEVSARRKLQGTGNVTPNMLMPLFRTPGARAVSKAAVDIADRTLSFDDTTHGTWTCADKS